MFLNGSGSKIIAVRLREPCRSLRKRRFEAAFISKLSDAEAEAAETQVWIEFAVKCGYADRDGAVAHYQTYEEVLRMIVAMIAHPEYWLLGDK